MIWVKILDFDDNNIIGKCMVFWEAVCYIVKYMWERIENNFWIFRVIIFFINV